MDSILGIENIYWLFSSSAQSIAAFIGFLAAGLFFSFDNMDKQVEKDETLEEIYNELKKQYYGRVTILFFLTAASIIFSLAMVFLNGYNLGILLNILTVIVSILNIITILWAIFFIIFIIDPSKVQKAATKLISENENIVTTTTTTTEPDSIISRSEFIEKFIKLEKILKILAQKYQLYSDLEVDYRRIPLTKVIHGLFTRELISRNQFNDLLEVNKVRNLSAHGEINKIEMKFSDLVDSLITELNGKLDNF